MARRNRYSGIGCNSSRGQNLKIEEYYDIGSRLTEESSGGSGEVVKGIRKEDGVAFAVKVICMDDAREDRSQIDALAEVNHENIIKMEDWFETPDMLYIVMELAMGGELFGRIAQGPFSEDDAAETFRQMVSAVGHMHRRGMVHGDVKPENVLYKDEERLRVVLADFGFAQFLPAGGEVGAGGDGVFKELPGGTLSYMAPEMLLGHGHGREADMWSLGVVLFTMLGGAHPFGKRKADADHHVRARIERGSWRFYPRLFAAVSEEAKDLVTRLLVTDPALRLDYRRTLLHPWLQHHAPSSPPPLSHNLPRPSGALECSECCAGEEWASGLGGVMVRAELGLEPLPLELAPLELALAALAAHAPFDPLLAAELRFERGLQPLLSLLCSPRLPLRLAAAHALAALASRAWAQGELVRGGGARRLALLALSPAQPPHLHFLAALTLARLAAVPALRPLLLAPAPASCSGRGARWSAVLGALVALAAAPAAGRGWRAARLAGLGLAGLASHDAPHHPSLLAHGALPPLLLHAFAPLTPASFAAPARRALVSLAAGPCGAGAGGGGGAGGGALKEALNRVLLGGEEAARGASSRQEVRRQLRALARLLQRQGLLGGRGGVGEGDAGKRALWWAAVAGAEAEEKAEGEVSEKAEGEVSEKAEGEVSEKAEGEVSGERTRLATDRHDHDHHDHDHERGAKAGEAEELLKDLPLLPSPRPSSPSSVSASQRWWEEVKAGAGSAGKGEEEEEGGGERWSVASEARTASLSSLPSSPTLSSLHSPSHSPRDLPPSPIPHATPLRWCARSRRACSCPRPRPSSPDAPTLFNP